MRVKFSGFLFLILAVLLAGATSWAMPAAASSDKDGAAASSAMSFRLPTLGGLPAIDWGAAAARPAQATLGSSSSLSRFSVRLYGGLSDLAATDVNTGAAGYFDLMGVYAADGGGTVAGAYDPLHAGVDFGGDIVYQFSSRIGVGIGAGYIRSSSDSEVTLTGTPSYVVTGTTKLSAIPIRLAVFFDVPIWRKLSLTADAGAVYYAGLKLDSQVNISDTLGFLVNEVTTASRSNFDNLGFTGDLGLEYKFTPRLGFFVEAAGRYARFKTFAKADQVRTFSELGTETSTGKLYLQNYPTVGGISLFFVSDTAPVDDGFNTYREPKIDLSGVSVHAGIRIRF